MVRVLPAEDNDLQHLIALVSLCLGFATLLIGVAGPDERLAVQGVPLSTVLYIAAFLLAIYLPVLPATRPTVLQFLIPVALLGATLPLSLDQLSGGNKLFNLLASTFAASILFAAAVQRIGSVATQRILVWLLAVMLCGAVLYKLRYGFFDRQVLFLMNGPIVFARVMGLGCLCCMFAFRGQQRLILSAVFFLAVLWTASKGPILALLASIAGYVVLMGSRRERLTFAVFLIAAVVAVTANYEELSRWQPLSRVFLAMDYVSAATGGETDSVGSRLLLIRTSLKVLADHPFGVGIGGWSYATDIHWATYPHNFLIELWTEGGLLLGSAAALPYLAFVLRRVDSWWIICVFFLLCQMVSGDLLDSRYWLTFSILGFLCRSEGQPLVTPLQRYARVRESDEESREAT